MTLLTSATDQARWPGDPKVIQIGPSARPVADQTARFLGWFSMVLGAAELSAAPSLARMLGAEGHENLIRAFGAREVAAGITSLSVDRTLGLWSRVGGDIMDIAALYAAYRDDNPRKSNVGLALAAVAAIALLDLVAAQGSAVTHGRGSQPPRDYSGRSGFPKGLISARGAAKAPAAAEALPSS
jgi:hypothetical protein